MGWTLYGAPGWGSTLVEGALSWIGTEFNLIDVTGFDKPGPARDRLIAVNPLARVPTLIAPDGVAMTESAAIILRLSETHPDAHLAPAVGHPVRRAFLNRLIWFVSVVYPTFTYRDYPERWVPDATAQLRETIDAFWNSLWQQFESELGEGPWVLGETSSALDLYVAVMTRWEPRRQWFAAHCPRLHAIAIRAEALPALAPVIERNFPDA